MRFVAATLAVALTAPVPALAQQATFDVVAHQLTSAVKDKEPVDDKSSFAVGDRAYLWMKLQPSGDADMRVRWSVDGSPVWTSEPKTVQLGRTWVYKTVHVAGSWTAEIVDGADNVLATDTFTATGDAATPTPVVAKPAPMAAAPAPEPIAAVPAAMPAAEPMGTVTTEKTKPGTLTFDTPKPDPAPAPAAAPATPAATGEAATTVSVVEFKLATAVEDRQPVSPSDTFSAGDRVFAWAKLAVTADSAVHARWSRGDELVSVGDSMSVKASSGWRTWMSTEVSEAGSWKVELLDPDDNVIHTQAFTVR